MFLSTLENGKITKTVCEAVTFDECCNVLFVGAGSAGSYGADSAAREGADVILLELGENIGGMPVCGNVTTYYYGASGGSFEEDDQKNQADTVFLTNTHHWEQRQIRLTERLLSSGVRLFCRHSVIGLYFEDNCVIGVLAFDGVKEISIKADITVDATSDGHLIRMTDVKKQYGRPGDGSFVPFGVFLQFTKNGKLLFKNNDSGIMDHYSATDFSEKTIMAHANASYMLESREVVSCALHTGIREGLTYEGEDVVSYESLLLNKCPEKILFWAYADLDRHGRLRSIEEEMFQNWWVIANLSTVTINIPVSMGSVVPKGIRGLITAGRCLSCDTYSQSAIRMNRDMFRMGECLGIATAMATLEGKDLLDIDYAEYLARAKKRGCYGDDTDERFYFDNSYGAYLKTMELLGRTPDQKYEALSPADHICTPIRFDVDKQFDLLKTDAPGVAIWSCYVASDKDAVRDRLSREMQNADDSLYRYNCAIALGLLEDERALPVLREIVQNRDCFFFTDNRRSNQFRSAVAVSLLGRLGTEEDLPLLTELLSAEEYDRAMYHTLGPNALYDKSPKRNSVYFAMVTHAVMSIYQIYERCGLCMEQLHQFLCSFFQDGTVLHRTINADPGTAVYEEMNGFIAYMLKITQPKH
jgi:hypothetical protein